MESLFSFLTNQQEVTIHALVKLMNQQLSE
jgi:hypothetical protein